VSLDRFFPKRDQAQQLQIYRELRKHLNDRERSIYDGVIRLDGGFHMDPTKLLYLHGTGIEEAAKVLKDGPFDLIVSRAVMEHVADPDAAFSAMDRLLSPGGHMIHKIDLRDHGLFSDKGFHPLTFLTVPERIYRWMTRESGKPNRRLYNYYRQKTTELGYDSRILITRVVGREDEIVPHKERVIRGIDYSDPSLRLLANIRPHLDKEFISMPDEELVIAGVFLIAGKR